MQTNTTTAAFGKLIVSPKEAHLTHDTEIFAKMDPYVIVKYNGIIHKSKVHSGGGKKPKWSDTFIIECNGPDTITVTVMDEDMAYDDLVGETTIKLQDFMKVGKSHNWHELQYKGKRAGQILMDIEFYSHSNLGMPQTAVQSNLHQVGVAPGFTQALGQGIQTVYLIPQGYQAVPPGMPYMPAQPVYYPPQPQMGFQPQYPMPQPQMGMPGYPMAPQMQQPYQMTPQIQQPQQQPGQQSLYPALNAPLPNQWGGQTYQQQPQQPQMFEMQQSRPSGPYNYQQL